MSYLGIDVGGTKVALRVHDHTGSGGTAEDTFLWSASSDAAGDLELLAERIRALLRRHPSPLGGVGVAVPAVCDAGGTVLTWPGRPSWVGLDLRAALAGILPDTPVACADDGDLAALAEAREADCANLLYLGVGTGIGGGLVFAGRSWPGPARGSFEIGHLVIDRAGPRCDCGRRGCAQAVASGPATLRRAAELRGREVTFPDLVEAAGAGAAWAVTALEENAAAVARVVVGVCELAHPDLVLVGGGFAAGAPGLVDAVAAHVKELTRPGVAPPPVRPAVLGGRSSLYGALLLAEETFGTVRRAAG
ncbi:ROK family protein [Streptomyces sp. NPDC088816]|uniref:ROK family protein n=1 Tax=Streptomyces sp. NPDC088816 TaxID=3365906 RepID=UPI0038229617